MERLMQYLTASDGNIDPILAASNGTMETMPDRERWNDGNNARPRAMVRLI